jgi:hypothetical protein
MKREQAAAAEKLPELSVEPEAAAAAQGPDSTESAILPDNMAATATPAELKASAPAEGPNRTAREDRQRSKAGTKAPVEDRSAQFNQTGSFSR